MRTLKFLRLIVLLVVSLYISYVFIMTPEYLSDFMKKLIGIYFLIEGIDYFLKIIGTIIEEKINRYK